MLDQINLGDLQQPPPLDASLSLRLTRAERDQLDRVARAAGTTPGRLLRAMLRGALRRGLAGAGRTGRPTAAR